MHGRIYGKKVLEHVLLMSRGTFLTLITTNASPLLSFLSEFQGCLVEPLRSQAYIGGSSLAGWGVGNQDSWAGGPHLVATPCPIPGVQSAEAAGG